MFHVAFLSDRNATRIHIHPASPAGSYHNYLKAIPISFSPEAFHRGIIPAVSFSAHTAVYDTAVLSTSSHDHIIKCIHYKLFIVASAHRDPYGHISIQIQNTGYVEFSLSGRDHCCIAEHLGIGLFCCKVSVDQVIYYQFIVI